MRERLKYAIVVVLTLSFWPAAPAQASSRPVFEVPPGPRTTWRGRIRIRYGPFARVYRERWGAGITPVGGAVLTNLISTAGQVAGYYFGYPPGQPPNGREGVEGTSPEIRAVLDDIVDETAHAGRMDELEMLLQRSEELVAELESRFPPEPGSGLEDLEGPGAKVKEPLQ